MLYGGTFDYDLTHGTSLLLNTIISHQHLEKNDPFAGCCAVKNKRRPAVFVDVAQR